MIRSKLLGVFLLVSTPRDGRHLGTHRLCEQDTIVSEPTDTQDTNAFPRRSCAHSFKRRKHGDTATEHRCSAGEVHFLRDRNGKPGGSTPVVCEAALGKGSGLAGVASEVGLVSHACKGCNHLVTVLFSACKEGQPVAKLEDELHLPEVQKSHSPHESD